MTSPYDGTPTTSALVDPVNLLPNTGTLLFGYGDNIPQGGRTCIPVYPADIRSYAQLGTAAQLNSGTSSGTIPVLGVGGKLDSSTMPSGIATQVNSDWNSSSGVSQILNKPSFAWTFNYPTRALNTAFQISTTQNSLVSYTVDIGATLTLTGGATGTVILESANDSGFTSGVQTVNSTANGNTGTLTIGLSLTQTSTATLSGGIPAGKYVRLRTVNTTGTPTFTFRSAQEILI